MAAWPAVLAAGVALQQLWAPMRLRLAWLKSLFYGSQQPFKFLRLLQSSGRSSLSGRLAGASLPRVEAAADEDTVAAVAVGIGAAAGIYLLFSGFCCLLSADGVYLHPGADWPASCLPERRVAGVWCFALLSVFIAILRLLSIVYRLPRGATCRFWFCFFG